ncbi:MAG: hypothetical protein QOI25_1103 [Mycobacterium sp.]|nr:hypothetical protein [Mycobacterium sp.]
MAGPAPPEVTPLSEPPTRTVRQLVIKDRRGGGLKRTSKGRPACEQLTVDQLCAERSLTAKVATAIRALRRRP